MLIHARTWMNFQGFMLGGKKSITKDYIRYYHIFYNIFAVKSYTHEDQATDCQGITKRWGWKIQMCLQGAT